MRGGSGSVSFRLHRRVVVAAAAAAAAEAAEVERENHSFLPYLYL